MTVTIDPRLLADTDLIGEFSSSFVLLHQAAIGPWIILVPKQAQVCEFHHLDLQNQQHLLQESNIISTLLETLFQPKTLNLAMLGNHVAQLHFHHVARYEDDAVWPDPIWGRIGSDKRCESQQQALIVQIQAKLAQQPDFHALFRE